MSEDATTVTEQQEESAKSTKDLFNYCGYVHVGPGAEECEDRENGKCGDPLHFHAWCRLPNQFEHQKCKDRALAAKARRIRQLRDEDSDSHTILESDLYELERIGDDAKAEIVEELVAKDWWRDHLEAMKDAAEDDEFEHIADDQQRYAEIVAMPAEEQPAEERDELVKHVAAYGERVVKLREERVEPRKAALMAKPLGELITLVREDRIKAEGQAVFAQVYNTWEWFYGTMKPVEEGRPHERVWAEVENMEASEPHVVEAIARHFEELERSLHGEAAGNS